MLLTVAHWNMHFIETVSIFVDFLFKAFSTLNFFHEIIGLTKDKEIYHFLLSSDSHYFL